MFSFAGFATSIRANAPIHEIHQPFAKCLVVLKRRSFTLGPIGIPKRVVGDGSSIDFADVILGIMQRTIKMGYPSISVFAEMGIDLTSLSTFTVFHD